MTDPRIVADPSPPPPRWEVEDTAHHFRHRVVCGDERGEWRTYGAVATLTTIDGRHLAACTTAFEGSLPTERVFEVRPC